MYIYKYGGGGVMGIRQGRGGGPLNKNCSQVGGPCNFPRKKFKNHQPPPPDKK